MVLLRPSYLLSAVDERRKAASGLSSHCIFQCRSITAATFHRSMEASSRDPTASCTTSRRRDPILGRKSTSDRHIFSGLRRRDNNDLKGQGEDHGEGHGDHKDAAGDPAGEEVWLAFVLACAPSYPSPSLPSPSAPSAASASWLLSSRAVRKRASLS